MFKKTMTYVDFDGNTRTEDFYFNLKESEIAEMELEVSGGLNNKIETIIKAQNSSELLAVFKDLILRSYGVKSPDGRLFIKNKELRDEFEQTNAYSDLFMELSTNDEAAAAFVNGIIPDKVKK